MEKSLLLFLLVIASANSFEYNESQLGPNGWMDSDENYDYQNHEDVPDKDSYEYLTGGSFRSGDFVSGSDEDDSTKNFVFCIKHRMWNDEDCYWLFREKCEIRSQMPLCKRLDGMAKEITFSTKPPSHLLNMQADVTTLAYDIQPKSQLSFQNGFETATEMPMINNSNSIKDEDAIDKNVKLEAQHVKTSTSTTTPTVFSTIAQTTEATTVKKSTTTTTRITTESTRTTTRIPKKPNSSSSEEPLVATMKPSSTRKWPTQTPRLIEGSSSTIESSGKTKVNEGVISTTPQTVEPTDELDYDIEQYIIDFMQPKTWAECKDKKMWTNSECFDLLVYRCGKGMHRKVCNEFQQWNSQLTGRTGNFKGLFGSNQQTKPVKDWKYCQQKKHWKENECKIVIQKECSEKTNNRICKKFKEESTWYGLKVKNVAGFNGISRSNKNWRTCKNKENWVDSQCYNIVDKKCGKKGKHRRICDDFKQWSKQRNLFDLMKKNGEVKMAGFNKESVNEKKTVLGKCRHKSKWKTEKCKEMLIDMCSKGGNRKICQKFEKLQSLEAMDQLAGGQRQALRKPKKHSEKKASWKHCKEQKNWKEDTCQMVIKKKCNKGASKKICQQFETWLK